MLGISSGLSKGTSALKSIVKSGLQAWYRSDSIQAPLGSVRDYSKNTNDATLHSGVALEFVASENDKIDFGNPGYNLKTVAFWIQVADVTSNEEPLMEFKTSNGISSDDGTITTAGTWTGVKIYVDGVEASSITASTWHRVVLTTTAAIVVDDFVVGYDDTTYGDFKIADLQIYDVVWDSSDVTYDYNNRNKDVFQNGTTSIVTSNCKALYRFNEGAGTRVYNAAPVLGEEEKVVNGNFTSSDNWESNDNVTIENGLAKLSRATGVSGGLRQNGVFEFGKTYEITYEIVTTQTNGFYIAQQGAGVSLEKSVGVHTYTYSPGGSSFTYLNFVRNNEDDGPSIDFKSISVKEITLARNYAITGAAFVKTQTHIPQFAALSYSKKMIFDGSDDHVSLGSEATFAADQAFSISFWISQNAQPSTDYIFGRTSDDTNRIVILNAGSSVEKIGILMNGEGDYMEVDTDNHPSEIEIGELNHVVITCGAYGSGANNVKAYLNGAVLADKETRSNESFTFGHIGRVTDGPVNYFEGIIDEVSTFNKELSSDEVGEIYNSGMALNVRDHSASSNLVGYWRNNGTDTWHDLSTNSNNGTVNGTPTTIKLQEVPYFKKDVLGLPMNRVRQRGLNFEEGAARTPKIERDNAGAITLEAWVYPYSEGTTDQAVIGTSGTQYLLYRPLSSNYYRLYINGGTPDANMAAQTSNLALGQWHHIVAVYDKTLTNEQNIYVNGVSNNAHANADADGFANPVNGAINADVLTSDSYTSIGEYNSLNNFYGGIIDDVKIYDRRLTLKEIKRNYRATKRAHTDNTSLWSDDFNQTLV